MFPRFAVLLLSAAALVPALAHSPAAPSAPPRLTPVVVHGSSSCSAEGLCLTLTVALADPADPAACASSTQVVADVGDQLSWCYTLTNNSSQTLARQTLSDSVHGTVFSQVQQTLAPGESYQYVSLEIAGAVIDADVVANWTASASRPTYTWDDTVAYDYIDASDGTRLELVGGSAMSSSSGIQAPFPINFFGSVTDQLCVGKNGAVVVGLRICQVPMTLPFPSSYANAVIAPMWSSYAVPGGSVYTKTLGTPGQRQFVIEWKDMALDWPSMPGFTFETVLDEASGTILFQYQSTGSGDGSFGDAGESAISGLQADSRTALAYSNSRPLLTPGKAVLWTPQVTDPAFSTTATAQVDIGAPQLAVPITELNAQAATGIRITQPLVIGNDGNRRLSWSAGAYPATQVLPPRAIEARRPAQDSDGQRFAPRAQASAMAPSSILGALALPAYGIKLSAGMMDYVRFDLLAPTDAMAILPNIQQSHPDFSGGDFVDNDFSREWVLDYYREQLSTLDTRTGALQLVGWASPQRVMAGEAWWGTSWDPASGRFYAVSNNGTCHWSGLYALDLDTAAPTFIGPINTGGDTCVVDLAIDQNGQMYGLDTLNDVLLSIDKSSGAAQVVGPLGVDSNYAQSIKFDRSSGTLYWTSYVDHFGGVATIDPVTAAVTPVAPMGDGVQILALAIAKAGGDCTQPLDATWLSLETPSGAVESGTPYQLYNVDFDATALPPGNYDATICVFSNDPHYRTRPATVPVHFNVVPKVDEAIFSDGFDG